MKLAQITLAANVALIVAVTTGTSTSLNEAHPGKAATL